MSAQTTNIPTPDQAPLTKSQAARLSGLTGIDAAQLTGLSVAEISSKYRWRIDPDLLLFRRICGRVVKKDPATGVEYPVPFATVYAEDTTCSLLGLFPAEAPWAWFFPFWCETEVVAETTTDACGNFCVWVPRFEIEWILRFRLERICYLQLFTKPTVGSVLQYLQGNPIGPDPAPDATASTTLKPGTTLYQKAEQVLGGAVTRRLTAQSNSQSFGSNTAAQQALLASPAFASPLAPALPKQLRQPVRSSNNREEHLNAVRSTLANQLRLDASTLENLNLGRYYGPFLRCYDILVPEWVPIFEVPDISFRVTQNVNGTGTPVVIYSGGLFDIPWSTGNISNVTLIASQIAISTSNCNTPNVACSNVPSLEFVGLMPLVNPPSPAAPYVDTVAGFATRPNPPHPNGTIAGPALPPASTPYTGTLQLYGCNQVDDAAYYRLEFTYTPPGSTTPSALTPFTGLTWPLYREVGGILESLWPVSDANGWYPVILTSDGWFPNSMVLEWDTTKFANGLYTVQLEVANSSKALLATSSTVGFTVDNAAPVPTYSAVWSTSSDLSGAQPVPTDDCVVIDRGTTPVDIYIQVSYSVTANHLRMSQLSSGGCAGGANLVSATSPVPQSTPALTVQHWYEDETDTSFSVVATYVIPASYPQGVYSFTMYADSRAFNPAGSDAGPLDDWNYNPVYIYTNPSFSVGIVNA
jgi:hypothetical protein